MANERQPTTLVRLEEVARNLERFITEEGTQMTTPLDDVCDLAVQWLDWTYNFLSARNLYHKKHTLKAALLQKMATQLLSESELAAIDADAEKQLVGLDGDS